VDERGSESNDSAGSLAHPYLVYNLCDLLDHEEVLSGKVVELRTQIVRVNGLFTLGDEACVPRHPLIDAELHPDFGPEKCNASEKLQKLCGMNENPNNVGSEVLVIDATVVIGHFESYPTTEGFTKNGKRFRFRILDVRDIRE
jgi:hypothetical protein